MTVNAARYETPLIPSHWVDRDTAVVHELAKGGMPVAIPQGMTRDDSVRAWADVLRGDVDLAEVLITDVDDEDHYIAWTESHLTRAIELLQRPRTADPLIGDDSVYAAARQDAADHGAIVSDA